PLQHQHQSGLKAQLHSEDQNDSKDDGVQSAQQYHSSHAWSGDIMSDVTIVKEGWVQKRELSMVPKYASLVECVGIRVEREMRNVEPEVVNSASGDDRSNARLPPRVHPRSRPSPSERAAIMPISLLSTPVIVPISLLSTPVIVPISPLSVPVQGTLHANSVATGCGLDAIVVASDNSDFHRDSLLRGTEVAVCRPNLETREVCCLTGACFRHVKDRVERLVCSGGHQPLLVIHVGTNHMAREGVVGITRDFKTLGKKLRELKAHVTFSSIFLVRGFGPGKDRRVSEVNDWLRVWCQKEHFGFLEHSIRFLANGLLARDGSYLTRMGKRSFGDALASFVRKNLN
ncbi:RAC-gamma serine/threonine-protein kinase, partial [Varanus komodoensis]